ncbi:hypothetical protein CPAV1605_552 [seawater metagenome]|uniref:Uncharacterized protein n=1 Tax=seawater metagenome TaxID=1561972 RepID=A0A5E8CID0_9ZZZZ
MNSNITQMILKHIEKVKGSFTQEKILLTNEELKVILKDSPYFDESIVSGYFYTYLFSHAFYDSIDNILICESYSNNINSNDLIPFSKDTINNTQELLNFCIKDNSFWPEIMYGTLYVKNSLYKLEFSKVKINSLNKQISFKLENTPGTDLIPKEGLGEGILFIYQDSNEKQMSNVIESNKNKFEKNVK